jgi:4-hydroxybenzoyl-CoA thioesterase
MAKTFSVERKIRFSHCDPAGIVYFVNFFDMINALVEDWFEQSMGLSFDELHIRRKVGFPIVNTQCEFSRPCRIGEWLWLELRIAKLGRSSIEIGVRGRVDEEERFRARHKIALISLETFRALPIPDDMRAKMQEYVATA